MAPLVWFVTGCSSGFGEEFVSSILARGDKVIATARNLQKIRHLEQAGVAILPLDITDSQKSIRDTVSKAIEVHGRIDVLVNNAAYVAVGTWEELEPEDFVAQFDTNVFGTIKVTRALLPHFRQRREGTMVFIGSLSGWIGHPGTGAYAGSKFALEGIVESLRRETSHLGVRTLLIEPGRFRTLLLSQSNMKAAPRTIADYAERSSAHLEALAREDQNQPGDPVKLVRIILDLVRHEGVAHNREVPFRLPLGVDVFDDMKAKCEDTLRLLSDWKEIIRSTDYEA